MTNKLGTILVESGEAVSISSQVFDELQVLNLSGKTSLKSDKEKYKLVKVLGPVLVGVLVLRLVIYLI